ncbi:hypothetical protein EJB05_14934, partial [Eragrostis curvula]
MQEMDEHIEHLWKRDQAKLKDGTTLPKYKSYSQIVAEREELKQWNARMRAELEAEKDVNYTFSPLSSTNK